MNVVLVTQARFGSTRFKGAKMNELGIIIKV